MTILPTLFDNFFDDIWVREPASRPQKQEYSFVKTEAGYNLEIIAPGLNKEDFKVTIEDGTVLVNAENKKRNFKFQKSFKVSNDLDVSQTKAKYQAGILNIELYKDKKKTNCTSIKIE